MSKKIISLFLISVFAFMSVGCKDNQTAISDVTSSTSNSQFTSSNSSIEENSNSSIADSSIDDITPNQEIDDDEYILSEQDSQKVLQEFYASLEDNSSQKVEQPKERVPETRDTDWDVIETMYKNELDYQSYLANGPYGSFKVECLDSRREAARYLVCVSHDYILNDTGEVHTFFDYYMVLKYALDTRGIYQLFEVESYSSLKDATRRLLWDY